MAYEWVAPLIGGGVGAGLVTWLKDWLQVRENRRVDHLKDQLRCVYGPAAYFAEHSFLVNVRYGQLHELFQNQFCHQGGAYYADTSESGNEACSQMIDLFNTYGKHLRSNSEKLAAIVRDYYYLIESIDLPFFQNLVMEQTRLATESTDDNKKLPIRLALKMKAPIIYSTDTTTHIRHRFEALTSDLDRLRQTSGFGGRIREFIIWFCRTLRTAFMNRWNR